MDLRELHHKGTGLTGMPTTMHLDAGYTLPVSLFQDHVYINLQPSESCLAQSM
jgi:hypothetical protein